MNTSKLNKIRCPNKDNCKFDPFCYKLGPENPEKIVNGEPCIRTGTCWELLTGKVFWVSKSIYEKSILSANNINY